ELDSGRAGAYLFIERGKELPRQLPRRRIDEATAELRNLAPNVSLCRISQERHVRAFSDKLHVCPALGEACDATLALALDGIRVRWIEILQFNLAIELCLDRPNLERDSGRQLVVGHLLKTVASRNTSFQNLGIVEGRPDGFDRRFDALFAFHCQRHFGKPPPLFLSW